MTNYKEIKTSFGADKADEIEQEDDFPVEELVIDEKPVEEVAPPAPKKVEPQVNQEKSSRSAKRIQELLAERRELEAQLERERSEKLEITQKYMAGAKETKETTVGHLKATVDLLKKELISATKEGDAERVVQLQSDLLGAQHELLTLERELKTTATEKPVKEEKREVKPQVPAQALMWIEEHPEFKTDAIFNAAALAVNYQLINEGFNPESTEFYEVLSKRLSTRFPEVFGMKEKNDVSLEQDTDSSDSALDTEDQEDVKKPEPRKARMVEQTVSSSSRSSSMKPLGKQSTKVDLDPVDLARTERWGLDPKQLARRIAYTEKNKRPDGYTPIMINKGDK